MLSLTFDPREPIAALAAARQRLRERRPELLRRWGAQIVQWGHREFDIKSRGGTGVDGTEWQPNAPATLRRRRSGVTRIGVDHGVLDEPAGDLVELHRSSVTAGFGDPHAEFFDERRPLLPARLPDPWREHLESMAQEWLGAVVQG